MTLNLECVEGGGEEVCGAGEGMIAFWIFQMHWEVWRKNLNVIYDIFGSYFLVLHCRRQYNCH